MGLGLRLVSINLDPSQVQQYALLTYYFTTDQVAQYALLIYYFTTDQVQQMLSGDDATRLMAGRPQHAKRRLGSATAPLPWPPGAGASLPSLSLGLALQALGCAAHSGRAACAALGLVGPTGAATRQRTLAT